MLSSGDIIVHLHFLADGGQGIGKLRGDCGGNRIAPIRQGNQRWLGIVLAAGGTSTNTGSGGGGLIFGSQLDEDVLELLPKGSRWRVTMSEK